MACFLAFVLLLSSFFLCRSGGEGMANFMGKTEVAIEFYAKFWAEIRLKIFPNFFFYFARKIFTF